MLAEYMTYTEKSHHNSRLLGDFRGLLY